MTDASLVIVGSSEQRHWHCAAAQATFRPQLAGCVTDYYLTWLEADAQAALRILKSIVRYSWSEIFLSSAKVGFKFFEQSSYVGFKPCNYMRGFQV